MTCTVKLKTPAAEGVPAIAPVAAFNAKPGGSEPPVTFHERALVLPMPPE